MVLYRYCLAILLTVSVQATHEDCYKAMACQSREAKEATYQLNKEVQCRTMPESIACAEKHNILCEDEEMHSINQDVINGMKEDQSKNCPGILKTRKLNITECSTWFAACIDPDFSSAASQQNRTVMCKRYPKVIQCLETVLSQCPGDEKTKLDLLTAEVKKMKKDTLTCPPTDDEDLTNGSQSSHLTSTVHTCFALIMVVLLH